MAATTQTALDVVTAALRLAGVLDAREEPSADDGAAGIAALNEMMHEWKARGCQYTHTALALTDAAGLDDKHIGGLKAMLAVRLAEGEFQTMVPATVAARADDAWRAILADTTIGLLVEAVTYDTGLTNMSTRGSYSGGAL